MAQKMRSYWEKLLFGISGSRGLLVIEFLVCFYSKIQPAVWQLFNRILLTPLSVHIYVIINLYWPIFTLLKLCNMITASVVEATHVGFFLNSWSFHASCRDWLFMNDSVTWQRKKGPGIICFVSGCIIMIFYDFLWFSLLSNLLLKWTNDLNKS